MKNEKRIIKIYAWYNAENAIVLASKFYSTIIDTMSQLDKYNFIQCERSHIVNLEYVDHIAGDCIILKDKETKLPISRLRKKAVKTAYKKFIEGRE